MMLTPAELDELKSRPGNDCAAVAGRWVTLRPHGGRMVGPCPLCSRDPKSRKAMRFEAFYDGWVCAVCQDGGDVIKLVMKHEGIDFRAAVEWLGGSRAVDPAIAEKRERERAEKEAAREADAQRYREYERHTLYDVWNAAKPFAGSAAEDYLRLRGIESPNLRPRLRCVSQMPYFHGQEIGADGRKYQRIIHRGPAMAAPIVGPDGKFRGLHFTYIDLAQPNGKAVIRDPETGEMLPAKKVRGSMSGGHIELIGSRNPKRFVIGEGIETVLSVWLALDACAVDISETAFWSGVALGNIGGPALDRVVHPELVDAAGRARRVPGPDPDMDKPGLTLPVGVEDVVELGDGDSDRVTTHCALYRGARRWWAVNERLMVRLAWADDGMDFNDMVMTGIRDQASGIKGAASMTA